jgi:hypothetical protein
MANIKYEKTRNTALSIEYALVSTGKCPVEEFLAGLPLRARAKMVKGFTKQVLLTTAI